MLPYWIYQWILPMLKYISRLLKTITSVTVFLQDTIVSHLDDCNLPPDCSPLIANLIANWLLIHHTAVKVSLSDVKKSMPLLCSLISTLVQPTKPRRAWPLLTHQIHRLSFCLSLPWLWPHSPKFTSGHAAFFLMAFAIPFAGKTLPLTP